MLAVRICNQREAIDKVILVNFFNLNIELYYDIRDETISYFSRESLYFLIGMIFIINN